MYKITIMKACDSLANSTQQFVCACMRDTFGEVRVRVMDALDISGCVADEVSPILSRHCPPPPQQR